MNFDQAVLIWCIILPAAVAVAGCLIGLWCAPVRLGRLTDVEITPGLIVSLGWWLAVTASLILTQEWDEWRWWPDESWARAIWPLLAWVVLQCGTVRAEERAWRWVVAGILASLTAMVAMPHGEGWEDTFQLHRIWVPLITISCLVNVYALEQLSKSDGHRWTMLVALAGLGGPAALAAAIYASLTQFALAMIAATAAVAAFSAFRAWDAGYWTAAIPATVGAAGITAAARFNSFETYPAWVLGLMLFAPAIVTGIDMIIRRQPGWVRFSVSGLVSAAIVAACVWRVQLA